MSRFTDGQILAAINDPFYRPTAGNPIGIACRAFVLGSGGSDAYVLAQPHPDVVLEIRAIHIWQPTNSQYNLVRLSTSMIAAFLPTVFPIFRTQDPNAKRLAKSSILAGGNGVHTTVLQTLEQGNILTPNFNADVRMTSPVVLFGDADADLPLAGIYASGFAGNATSVSIDMREWPYDLAQ